MREDLRAGLPELVDQGRQLARDLPTRGTRGRVEARKSAESVAAVPSYEHPFYWSGFILVGDPR